MRGRCEREKIERLAKDHEIELTCWIEVIEEGWVGRPRGLLQVLWERGWINQKRISEYTLKGRAHQMDDNGKVLPEHQHFILHTLMSKCANFKEEKSAMEVLLEDLTTKLLNNQKVELLVSPKYHCKLAGKGVEYAYVGSHAELLS